MQKSKLKNTDERKFNYFKQNNINHAEKSHREV